ncbi:MAG: BON domain-containing protein [Gallionella sp.]|nr:BON domain-containing protein [Gallionella sp.]MDD4945422.1 BON domain-containing protein [Gallionella sp.]MDD5612191.1 BON domain-containing protein [Gallionella sp.]
MRIVLLLLVVSGLLQGCFPVVAAGAGAGVMMAQDRRTSGAYIEDEAIENKAMDRIGKQFGDKVHVNTTSYNRNVLLSGEVPDENTKAQVERIVANILNVRVIYNELTIGEQSSLTSRSNDTLITSNVKLRFVDDQRFSATTVKVVTEYGTVFLMGIVNHAEADAAAEVASGSKGVSRVVKLFEYVD